MRAITQPKIVLNGKCSLGIPRTYGTIPAAVLSAARHFARVVPELERFVMALYPPGTTPVHRCFRARARWRSGHEMFVSCHAYPNEPARSALMFAL